MDWKERININPKVCHGKPCIKGTRIWVSLVLDFLASGESIESFLKEYPQLTPRTSWRASHTGPRLPERVHTHWRHGELMKFKLDENFGPTVYTVFQQRGLDCRTVREESRGGATDEKVLEAAVPEGRILITMDRDFGNVLRYPPGRTAGIAVISPMTKPSCGLLRALVEAFVEALQNRPIRGKLWIVEPGRIREHEPDDPLGGNEGES